MKQEQAMKHKIITLKIMTLVVSMGLDCFAAIPHLSQCYDPDSKELNLQEIARLDQMAKSTTQASATEYLPMTLKASKDESGVAAQILEYNLDRLAQRGGWASTALAPITTINRTLSGGIAISEDNNRSRQLVNFNVNAAQAMAALEYQGYVNARLAYQAQDSSMDLTISRKIYDNTQVAFHHVENNQETADRVSLRWTW